LHDADGNLTNDGRFSYSWDTENRPTNFTRVGTAPSGSKVKLDCAYDPQWRRTQKIVSSWNGSIYVAQSTNKFVYDGWNLLAILDGQGAVVQSFTWGLDLSGTEQGAGGVGGLISMTIHQGTNAGTYFYSYDGNGNVVALVSAADGSVVARYEYGPFGEVLRATGPMARANSFLFSTKFYDWETGFYYYGYRYYDPATGRWPNRDPIGELGFNVQKRNAIYFAVVEEKNLYGFVANDAPNKWDWLGLCGPVCGCDLTDLVKKTLQEVEDTYKKDWTTIKRYDACTRLDGVLTGGTAWDMNITAPTPSATGSCALTATFEGKCFKISAINYALFGKMSKLCSDSFGSGVPGSRWSLEYSTGLAQFHKWGLRQDFTDEASQAFAFISYGFGSGLSYSGKDYAIADCQPSEVKCKGEKYMWNWIPNKKDF